MAPPSRAPRPDITYITRRKRPMPSVVAGGSSQTTAPRPDNNMVSRSSLHLEREPQGEPTTEASKHAGQPPKTLASLLFSAPAIEEVGHLSAKNPVVRLNARQSGIGTLLIAGAGAVAWEDRDLITGAETLHGALVGSRIETAGNRPLAGFHGGSVAVALRHVRQLRRVLVAPAEGPLVVTTFGGSGIAVHPLSSTGQRGLLYISQIDGLLELRAEYTANENHDDIWAEFGFQMTLPASAPAGAGGCRRGQSSY